MKVLLTIWMFSLVAIGFAQPYRFRHLTTSDGLLSDLKLVMTEDRQGRLWIGSDEGINIFDGYRITTFNQPDSAFDGSNNILSIYCDIKGTIWIATSSGVFFKNEHNSKFQKLPYSNELIADGVFFGENKEGQIVIASRNNCFVTTANKNAKKLNGFDPVFAMYGVLLSFEKFDGDQWLMGFRDRLLLVNITSQTVIKHLNATRVWCAAKVSDTTLLAGSFANDTISLVNIKTGLSERINDWFITDGKPIAGFAGSIVGLGNQKFAISCRYNGVYILDIQKRESISNQHDPADPASLKLSTCRRLIVTRNGTLFAHTRGLSFTQLNTPFFASQKYLINQQGVRYDGGFTSIVQDKKNNYWIGTNGHLSLWNRQANISTFYPFFDDRTGVKKFRTIRSVVLDRLDRVWVGTYSAGIGRLLPDGSFYQIRSISEDIANSIPNNDIHTITKDINANFLVCSNGGFALFDPISGKTNRFLNHPVLSKISTQTTFYLLADKLNNWWVAQIGGLYFYDRKKDSLHKITLGVIKNNIQTQVIATDSSGNIYAGTVNGLYIISPSTLSVKKFLSKKEGLTSNNIVGLLCDKQGMVWILGNIGISRYNPYTNELVSFDVRDGIEQSNHTLGNFYMAPDGEVFFTSSDGFNYFFPENIKSVKTPLKVMLTSIEFTDTTFTSPEITSYQLRHDQNNISFSFFAVDFQFGPSIQYRYQLQQFDNGFIHAGKERTARYTNLPPGKYRFIVEASLNGYDWFSMQRPVSIEVAKVFWKTIWFILGLSGALCGILFLIYSNRIKKIKREEALKRDFENQLAQVRMNLLRTQMNPHFLFNSLNSINSFILKNDRQNASGYLTKFSRLMRLILENSRNEWVSLESELKAIELYVQLEALRFNDSFSYDINTEKSIITEQIILPPMLIQPYIENAIWHGLMYRKNPGGLLSVHIKDRNNEIEICITDNGVGRAAADLLKSKSALQNKSYGMKITTERMRVVNMAYKINARADVIDLYNEEGVPTGTKVLLTINRISNKNEN